MKTRYGNGSYGVWYGALALNTTIHETAFHMVKEESGIEGNTEVIHRERAVYRVRCKALLCDPVRRTVTVERTVGKVMLKLQF